jgi:hypothetical protein
MHVVVSHCEMDDAACEFQVKVAAVDPNSDPNRSGLRWIWRYAADGRSPVFLSKRNAASSGDCPIGFVISRSSVQVRPPAAKLRAAE